jgi:exonuclease VII large subunit
MMRLLACLVGGFLAGTCGLSAQDAPPAAPGTPSIPEEFLPLQSEAEKLAQSVDTALGKVQRAMTEQNREALLQALDQVIATISDSISKTEKQLEPEAFKTMERAQEKSRDLKSKAAKPSLSDDARERLLKLADRYTANATEGVQIIKNLQDTRVILAKDLQKFEDEKEVILEELELLDFEETLDSLRAVVNNMQNVSLRIRGMVSGSGINRPIVSPPAP